MPQVGGVRYNVEFGWRRPRRPLCVRQNYRSSSTTTPQEMMVMTHHAQGGGGDRGRTPTILFRAAAATAAELTAVTESRSRIRVQGTWRGDVFESVRRTCGGASGLQRRVTHMNGGTPRGFCQRFLATTDRGTKP